MVRQLTPELGIRLALGAAPRDLRRMVMRRGLAIGIAGLAPGVLGALLANHLLVALLYEVSPTDGLTIVVAAGLLLRSRAALRAD
jgi:ABC-type antimicrobial peptide transport system permease subunit